MPIDVHLTATQVIGILFALGAMFMFGFADFCSGYIGKKTSAMLVANAMYVIEVPPLLVLLILSGNYGTFENNFWLFLIGILTVIGFLAVVYGFTNGKTSVVGPFVGLLALIIPTLFSVIIGEGSSALVWAGLVAAVVAILFITRESQPEEHEQLAHKKVMRISLICGLIAGTGFGFTFIGLGHIESPILMKLFITQVPGTVVAVAWYLKTKPSLKPLVTNLPVLLFLALLYNLAQAFFPWATERTSLVATNIIVNLYPGLTILLAAVIYKEKTNTIQKLGYLLAVAGLVCTTFGLS